MLCFTLLVLLHTCFSDSSNMNRIMGGWPARISEYPFVLSFETRYEDFYSQFCAASSIGNSWALTAAHCVNGILSLENMCLRAGSTYRESGGEIYNISEVILHPNYTEEKDFDLAIVKVSNPFSYSEEVQAVPLAHTTPPTGTPAVVLGWGTNFTNGTKPYHLQQVEVKVLDQNWCGEQYRNKSRITSRMLCASVPLGGKDACQGDAGGPLLTGGMLSGIVSWGAVCGDNLYPGVYTNVAPFTSWITSVTGIP